MSQHREKQEPEKHVEAGRLLSQRLRDAREMRGPIVCPACALCFDATHVVKCPGCRTFIDETFQAVSPHPQRKKRPPDATHGAKILRRKPRASRRTRENVELELDFFTQGYMEYKG